jgi:hypothetical protein
MKICQELISNFLQGPFFDWLRTSINLVFIFRCSSSTTDPVCARRVNLLVCSLPLHRHSYIGFLIDFTSSIHNNKLPDLMFTVYYVLKVGMSSSLTMYPLELYHTQKGTKDVTWAKITLYSFSSCVRADFTTGDASMGHASVSCHEILLAYPLSYIQ